MVRRNECHKGIASRSGWRAGASLVATLLVTTLLVCAPATAEPRPGDTPPAENRESGFTPVVESCADESVQGLIMRTFQERERDYWSSPLEIVGFERFVETGDRTNGLSYVPRRYCRAEALFNDGQRRRIVYNIGSQNGFIGAGPGIIWCVVGLDRERAFGSNCRAAGP